MSFLARVRSESVRDEAMILRESEQRVRAQADKTAREIISTAIQRVAADQASEITVTSVHIPSDDLRVGLLDVRVETFVPSSRYLVFLLLLMTLQRL